MLILDTDHLTAIDRLSGASTSLLSRLEGRRSEVCTTIIAIGEQLRGLLALIGAARNDEARIERYERLTRRLERVGDYTILRWTPEAQTVFNRLRREKLRIGTMDLRIASIALSRDATLLSANLRDFTKIPDLRVENWLTD